MTTDKVCIALVGVIVLAACSPASDDDGSSALGLGSSENYKQNKYEDGPFGIAMNNPIPDYIDTDKIENNIFSVKDPPKLHPDFEEIILVAYPDTGICTIRAIGRNLGNDGSGTLIRSKVDALVAALETKYGKGKKADLCLGGDIACTSDFWMMTLTSNERAYATSWETQNDEMKRLGIGSLVVAARALNIQTSYPILEFNSANEGQCETAANKSTASAL